MYVCRGPLELILFASDSSRVVAAEDVSVALSTPDTNTSMNANTSTRTNEATVRTSRSPSCA